MSAGTPVIGGAADHIASALGAGVVNAGDVLLKFGGSVDILTATDHARPDPRLFLDYHLKPGLFVPNGCMSTGGSALNWFVRQFACGEKQAAEEAGLSIHQWLDRLAEARPRRQRRARHHALFSRRKDADPRSRTRARPSMALRFRTTSAISGALFSRPTLMRSRITSRS